MSSGCFADRKTIFVVLLMLAVLALLAGHAEARNPDLSDKVINLSGLPGDETPGEKWDDAYQEIVVVGSTVHVVWWTVRYLISEQLYYRRSIDGGQTWNPRFSCSTPLPFTGTGLLTVRNTWRWTATVCTWPTPHPFQDQVHIMLSSCTAGPRTTGPPLKTPGH